MALSEILKTTKQLKYLKIIGLENIRFPNIFLKN